MFMWMRSEDGHPDAQQSINSGAIDTGDNCVECGLSDLPACVAVQVIWSTDLYILHSVAVKDSRLKDEDKDEDLKIGHRESSRTRTFLEDNNTETSGI